MANNGDEALELLKNTFCKGGLQFMCHSSPLSKQSRDKLKKEISKELLSKRIKSDEFLSQRANKFFDGNLFVELTFGLHKKRLGNKKNDIDNLIKHTLDCLKGTLFKDDGQVKRVCATKYFLNPPSKEWTGIRIQRWKNE